MINIVIPMAGSGQRFVDAGYKDPKPFIQVLGKSMIRRVVENLKVENANYILIARREHLANYESSINELKNDFSIELVAIDKLTEGTACTVLFARHLFNNEYPMMIANSDQIVDMNINDFINDAAGRKLDGSILTFIDSERNPKWSFAKTDETGYVTEVKEKEAISDIATVGIYYFRTGSSFADAAIEMIINNDRVNNEFYTCPVYNYLVKRGQKISVYNIDFAKMHGTGTPADLDTYCTKLKQLAE